MPFLDEAAMRKNFACHEEGNFLYFRFINHRERVICMKPPEGFENRLLVVHPHIPSTMNFYKKFPELEEFELPVDIDLKKDCYIGFYTVEDRFYKPYIYRASSIPEQPVVVEKKRKTGHAYYFKREDGYYVAEGNRLVSLFEEDERLFNKLRSVYAQQVNVQKMPIGLYEDTLPVVYFGKELNFLPEPGKEMVTKCSRYKTLRELHFAYPESVETFNNYLRVIDPTLIGENFPSIAKGDFLQVTHPKEKKKLPLLHQTGEVVDINKTSVSLKFMNYFVETFHIKELSKS